MSDRLHSLSSRVEEQLRQFATEEEEDRRLPGAARVGMAGAAAAGGVYGGTTLRNSVINRAGVVDDYGNMVGRKGMYRDAAKGTKAYAKGVEAAGKFRKSAVNAADAPLRGVGRMAGKVGKWTAGARKKLYGLEETVDRIVHLSAAIETLDFQEKQRNPIAVGYAGGLANGMPGSILAIQKREKFRDSGLTYRKRDAAMDGIKGSATAAGGLAAAGAGALGLSVLAAKRKLPKGMLRKAGVRTGQFLKKVGKDPAAMKRLKIGAMTAGGVGALAAQNASANKRYKERMRQRLEGGEG